MRRAVGLLILIVLAITSCADDEVDFASLPTPTPTQTPTPACAAPDPQPIDGDAGVQVAGTIKEKPMITLPGGDPDCKFYAKDIEVGKGKDVLPGATVTAHYVGVSWIVGQEFDASWSGDPVTFPLTGVVKGWGFGLPGMKVGGRRLLVIPPDFGYGPDGRPPAIAPNDTLVFVVDMVDTL